VSRDKKNELFYLVDEEDKVIGTIIRSKAHSNKNAIHRSISIIAINDKNQMLLQKRSKLKDTFPGFWTLSVTGHVTYGQTYKEAARRELFEELRIKIPLKFLRKILLKMTRETEYSAVYEIMPKGIPSLVADPDEIDEVGWIDIKNLKKFIKENKVTEDALLILKATNYI